MDDMEEIKDAKVTPFHNNSILIAPVIEPNIEDPLKLAINDQNNEVYKECVKNDSNITPSQNISSSSNLVNESKQITVLEVSEDKTNIIEKSEIQEKTEESTANTKGLATGIGIPLARSSPISREFLALQKSLNESKILTGFVADTSAVKTARKGRKSGLALISSGNRENSLHKISNRNRIDPLDISSEERAIIKRANMRSQNSEFAQKHMDFLSRVIQQQQSGDEQYASDIDDIDRDAIGAADDDDERHTSVSNSSAISSDLGMHDITSLETRLKDVWQAPPKRGWDSFCWRCRDCADSVLIPCSKCLRCFHKLCIKVSSSTKLDNSWNCLECLAVENALSSPKKVRRPEVTLDMLSELLSFALKRMRTLKGNSKFLFADADFSSFSKYIVNPVTFASLEEKISKKAYRYPEEFYNETKWMVHNAHILTTGLSNNKLVILAKSVVKVCRQEANEIETCAGCYFSANTRSDWFVDVCAQPHLLLWAKLKGFPYWPAKAMGIGQNAVVNVRFFGKHDRAFVPIKDCFLFSEQDPNTQTGKRSARELADCIKEVEIHIKKIEAKIGKFNYAPFKTSYDPAEEQNQLELMMPGVTQYMKRQQAIVLKPSLQYKIVKTADNNLSIIKKPNSVDNGNDNGETALEHVETTRKDSPKASTSSSSSESSKHLTSKYEVITKTISNDSNSPKVSTVILKKRKSINIANTIMNNDEKDSNGSDKPSAKMSKIVHSTSLGMKISSKSGSETSTSTSKHIRNDGNATTMGLCSNIQQPCKRKQDAADVAPNEDIDCSGVEKHKAKHSRSEPRLPIITIKTTNAKIVEPTAREVAENFAKSNTCVTIKKIPKNILDGHDKCSGSNLETNNRATRSTAKDISCSAARSTSKEKNTSASSSVTVASKSVTSSPTAYAGNSQTQSKTSQTKLDKNKGNEDRNIFRELVPFVEIKQEVNSDEEIETAIQSADIEKSVRLEKAQQVSVPTSNCEVALHQDRNNEKIDSLLSRVKEEMVSDEETMSAPLTKGTNDTLLNSISNSIKDTNSTVPQASVAGNTLSDGNIRVVGDTTIQRVSMKNSTISAAALQQNIGQLNGTTTAQVLVPTSPPNVTSNNSGAAQSKRSSNRTSGVPFGPLPASASSLSPKITASNHSISTSTIDNAFQQQPIQQGQGQRARKSFPNRSPPRIGSSSFPTTVGINNLPVTVESSTATANTVGDPKRGGILKSTSMVSIPVDIASQRNIAQNSIPMPPLTAVSKTTPIVSSVTNSIAASNSPASSPSSLTSFIGTITPAAFANSKNNANSNANSGSSIQNPLASMGATNQIQKINAPPPLAGLSYSNVNSTIPSSVSHLQSSVQSSASVSIPSGSCAVVAANNNDSRSPNAADNHLLGDFVTPALANAITEVICRGPPKMARRPNGPLQSDGSTMFPSEAGPVCRTLVQNAHKLTDFFISVMEDTMCDISNGDEPSLQAKITLLTIELERMKQSHEQEIAELKRTSDLMLCEMRKSMENEKTRIANEIRKQCELERLRSVEEAKRKQWCANCGREAQFYCCWNTSYCDYPCQQQHWGRHATTCAQTRSSEASSSNSRSTGMGTSQPVISTANTISSHAFNSDMRHKMSTLNSGSMNINIHYNKNVSNSKKEKQNVSSSGSSLTGNKNSVNVAIPSGNSIGSDALKLPTNTYLRPVAPNNSGSNGNNSRSSGFGSSGPSRFNISLPITSAVNPPTPYTIVQRGNNWELLTTTSNTTPPLNSINTMAGMQPTNATLSTISNTHQHQQQQQTQQQRSATMPTIISKTAGGRNRMISNIGYAASSNGNMRQTKM